MLPLFLFLGGVTLGLIAGLLPGIHPNLIALLLASTKQELYFIIPLAVVNSIVDTIPSILFGAPDAGSELSVLPGHRMLMKGLGYNAVRKTVIGSLLSGIFAIILLPIAFLISKSYNSMTIIIPILLIIIVVYTIFGDKNSLFAAFCFVFSGIIGILSFRLNISSNVVLVPILSGLFGLSRIITSLKTKSIPPQRDEIEFISSKTENRSVFVGSLLGMISGFIPGVGSSQAAYIASSLKGDFLTSLGAITTSNVIFSFLALYFIGKVRSGVAASISFIEMDTRVAAMIFLLCLMSIPIGSILTLLTSKIIIRRISNINYRAVNMFVGILIISVVFALSGLLGLLLLFVSTSLGIMAITKRVKQSNLLGVIIIPTLIYFITNFI